MNRSKLVERLTYTSETNWLQVIQHIERLRLTPKITTHRPDDIARLFLHPLVLGLDYPENP
jgi:hypothetical protein